MPGIISSFYCYSKI